MTMAWTTYKLHNITKEIAVTLLVSKFIGQLTNWWDHSMSSEEKTHILEYKILEETPKGNNI